MTEEPDIHGMVRNHDRDTSVAAAKNAAKKAPTLRKRVYEALAARGSKGLTDIELNQKLGLDNTRSSARTRRRELEEDGLVRDSGQRVTHPERGTERYIVWVLTDHFDPNLVDPDLTADELEEFNRPKSVRTKRKAPKFEATPEAITFAVIRRVRELIEDSATGNKADPGFASTLRRRVQADLREWEASIKPKGDKKNQPKPDSRQMALFELPPT